MPEIAPSADVQMVNAAGEPFVVPAADVAQNQQAGLRVVDDPAELAALKAKAFGSDHPVLAAGAGALDSLTIGAAPALLQGAGVVQPGTFKGLQEGSPTAFGGGQVAGAVLPAVFSDGASLAAEGATGARVVGNASKARTALEALAAPTNLVTKTGRAAESLAGGGAAGTFARGAVEGGLYGSGSALSESAIDNKPLTAELLLTHGGGAALFGGFGGVGLEKALGFAEARLPAALESASGALEKVSGHLEELGPGAAAGRADAAVQAVVPKVERAVEEAHGVRRDLVDSLLGDAPAVPQASEVVARLRAESERLPTDSAGQAVLDKVTARLEGKLGSASSAAEQMQALEKAEATLATQEVLGPARAQLRATLGSEQLWGRAGAVQEKFASHLDALQAAQAEVAPLLKSGGIKRAIKEASEGNTEGVDALRAYVDHARGLVDHATELAQDVPSGRRNITQISSALDAVKGSADSAVSKATPSGAEHVLEALGGLLPHHVEAVAKTVLAPSRQAEVVAHVIGKAAKVSGAIARLSKEALSGAAGVTSKATGAATRLADMHFGTEAPAGESRAAGVARHLQDHAAINNLPVDQLAQRLVASTPTLGRHAPAVAVAVQQGAVRAQQVLSAAAPKNPRMPSGLPGEPAPTTGAIAHARYEQVARAVTQPLSLLEDMKVGRLSASSVAAVAQAYPALYQHMVEQVTQAIGERNERIPYQQRMQLGVLLQKPVENLAALQATFAAPSPKPASAAAGGLARQTNFKAAQQVALPTGGTP